MQNTYRSLSQALAPRSSWLTTLGGVFGALGTALIAIAPITGIPVLAIPGAILTALGHLLTGGAARDNRVSDESAGAKPQNASA